MPVDAIACARKFVKGAQLPVPRPSVVGLTAPPEIGFEAARQQAAVVGAEVIAFVTGVTAEQRSDIVNATLLAQLVAKKKVPEPQTLQEVLAWYDHYFNALSQVGFLIQDQGFARYIEKSDNFEAHQAILDVAAVLLAGSPAALLVVKKTLNALQKMSADSPWITLFNRESHSATTARFQLSVVDANASGPFLMSVIAFGLEAQQSVTQVLFFKFRRNTVTLQHHSGKATIDAQVLDAVRNDIAARLQRFAKDFVAGVDL